MTKPVKNKDEMSFFEHIEVLRWHIVRSLAAIFLVAIVAFLFPEFVFEKVLKGPMNPDFWTYEAICSISETLCFKPTPFDLITRELGEQFIVFSLGVMAIYKTWIV